MKGKRPGPGKFLLLFLLLCAAGILLWILVPRHYPVSRMKARAGTAYWKLSTGSQIAYNFLPAKGNKQPYPVIFLQGGPGGYISERLVQSMQTLADEGYDVYLYDQVGSGLSKRLYDIREYTAVRHKKDLAAIVEQTGSGKVILIGQSWGAILAALFLADHPDKVSKVILTGPGPVIPVNRVLATVIPPDSLDLRPPVVTNAMAVEQVQNGRMQAASLLAGWFGYKLVPDAEADDFQTLLNNGLNRSTVKDTAHALPDKGGGGYYAQQMTALSFSSTPDPRARLRKVTTPVLILRGQYDNQPWGYVTEYLELLQHCRLEIIEGAGHNIATEQEDAYYNRIRQFLNDE